MLFNIVINKTVTKDYKIVTPDKFTMTATLQYPKVKDETNLIMKLQFMKIRI